MRWIVLREGNVIDNGRDGLAKFERRVYVAVRGRSALSPLRLSLIVTRSAEP